MTVERAIYYQRYIGLSADDKPLPLDDTNFSLMPGAEFFETDTWNLYTWTGDAWVLTGSQGIKIFDTQSSVYKGLQFNAEAPQVCSQSYLYAIAEGDISGHSNFSKYGRITTITTSVGDVWSLGGTYVWQSSAGEGLRVISSSCEDCSTGKGAQKIKIIALNTGYDSTTWEITMNGTNPVVVGSTALCRINRVYVSQSGTNYAASANIDIYSTGSTTPTFARIEQGLLQGRRSMYTVPSGKTLYITSMRVSAGVGGTATKLEYCTFTLKASVNSEGTLSPSMFYPKAEVGVLNGSIELDFEAPEKIQATADVKISVFGDSAQGAAGTVALRGWIE